MGCRPASPLPGHGPTRQTGRRSHVTGTRSAERGPDFARGAPTAGPEVPAVLRGIGYRGQSRSAPCPILSRPDGRVQCRAITLSSAPSLPASVGGAVPRAAIRLLTIEPALRPAKPYAIEGPVGPSHPDSTTRPGTR